MEHWVASHFKGKAGGWWKSLRFFSAWLVLFGSKFAILEALDMAFGDSVQFEGWMHGIVWLIIVVVTMDFMAQVQNYVMSQQYESLLRKANFKGGIPTR